MRQSALIAATFAAILLLSVVFAALSLSREYAPDLLALAAMFLGLTARGWLFPSVLAAVFLGYLADLVYGTPVGLLALAAGCTAMVGHMLRGKVSLRGAGQLVAFAAVCAGVFGLLLVLIRSTAGLAVASLGAELTLIGKTCITTGIVGPVALRSLRAVDARFLRTERERDAALEGLLP